MGGVLKTILAIMLASLTFSGLVTGCSSSPAPAQVPQIGGLAPDFQLLNLDGQVVALSGLRGRPVMLNFWATWCGPCQAEMPFIQEVFEEEEWSDEGLVILTVNVGEDLDRVTRFMESHSFSFPVLLDIKQSVARDYNIRGIPTTFFIDEDGIIQDMKIGAFSGKAEIERRLINSIVSNE